MAGDLPTTVGGDPPDTDMATIMAITIAIQGDIVPGIMLAGAPLMADLPHIPTDPGQPTMFIIIVPRGSGGPGTIPMTPGQETGSQLPIAPDLQHNQPTGPIMSIRTGMAMYIVRMGMTLTGYKMAAEPPGRTGHRRDSNLRPGSNPPNRTAPQTAIPGRDHQVRAI